MPTFNLPEIKSRADIRDLWSGLGGSRLRNNRGQAWWRGGSAFNVAINPQRGTWHDFVTGEGGDVIRLVETVRQCGFRDAVEWLADFAGVQNDSQHTCDRDPDSNWPADLKWATWWRIAAEMMAESALEKLPHNHPERRGLTDLLKAIRLGDSSLVGEYRDWRRRDPKMTAALCRTGRELDVRRKRNLAAFVMEMARSAEA